MSKTQQKQNEWYKQWQMFRDDELFLFQEWIKPATLETFKDKNVLECGCGGGQHTSFIAPYAASVTSVDLNTVAIARERNKEFNNVKFVEGDIATIDLEEQFDVVICIGVIHHTDDPDKSFTNMYKHCKPGGTMIIWTYSAEGNALVRFVVEPFRKLVLKKMPRFVLSYLSKILCILIYPIVYSVYLIPSLSFLPYYDYFVNFRRLNYKRNVLNIFDKLNAPQTYFTTHGKCYEWFNSDRFIPKSISISKYAGVSYSLVGIKH